MTSFALTIVRHAETSYNKKRLIQGQLDIPLSSTGHLQAEILGTCLQKQSYSHVYVSDSTRTKQTAEDILSKNHCKQISVVQDQRLRERKFGSFEGKSFLLLKEFAEKSNQKIGDVVPPGGETASQVHERAVNFFQELCTVVEGMNKDITGCIKKNQNEKSMFNVMNNDAGIAVNQSELYVSETSENLDISSAKNACQYGEKTENFHEKSIKIDKQSDLEFPMGLGLKPCLYNDEYKNYKLAANILVVSHGGWIRELFCYFVEYLKCMIPGGNKQATQISPNTGVSKFIVELKDNVHPKVICLQIHDKLHLLEKLQ